VAGRFVFLNRRAAATRLVTTARVVITAVLLAIAGCEDGGSPAITGPVAIDSPQAAASSVGADDRQASDVSTAAASAEDNPSAVNPSAEAGSPPVESNASTASRPERTRDISFDDLKFDIAKGDPFQRSLLTEKIEALEGKPIRIRGYILPSFQQSGLTQFVLVRDNQSCCFGPGAALYDCIIVEMKPGRSTDYSLYPVAVDGTFSIREMLDPDGKTVAIFHLDGESVR
jgi:hypothetical protein